MKFFYKLTYGIICLVYSRVLTILENSFLKRNFKTKISLENDGFLKITSKSKLNISQQSFDYILNEMSFFSNNYQKKFILSPENLTSTIKLIFNKQFCNYLTSITGFKYSIDFFGAYQNLHIPEEHIDKPWYANHFHFDKPNSKNMLKIFIPLSDISKNDGPLELIDLNQKKRYLVGGKGDVFLCKLNACLHKAGVPKHSNKTNLIMIQLNPSKKWYLSLNLYQRQFKREPKFTSFTNIFVRRMLLN